MINDIISKHKNILCKPLDEIGMLNELYEMELLCRPMLQECTKISEYEVQLVLGLLRESIGKTYKKVSVLMFSFFTELTLSNDVFVWYLKYQLSELDDISLVTRNYIFQQTIALEFNKPSLSSRQSIILMWKIQHKLVDDYSYIFKDKITQIKKESRNKNVVVVITDQLLGANHSPTKKICDHIAIMISKLGKNVVLINTAETLSIKGYTPLFTVVVPNYIGDYLNFDKFYWNGCKIPFFQCENCMPNEDIISMLIDTIYKLKPEYIILNGAGVITGNILSKIVPTIAFPLSFAIPYTTATFQSKMSSSNCYDDEYIHLLKELNISEDYIIPMSITYTGMNSTGSLRREDFGIPKDAFVCVIVGTRLDNDLSDDFWKMINSVKEEKLFVLLVGNYSEENLDRIRNEFKELRIHCIGYVNNLPGLYDICDLYINPRRIGGGFSALEALCNGVPVVTYNYGDVASNAGKLFCVENTEEMVCIIKKYINQSSFYEQMSNAAKEYAMKCSDQESILRNHLTELENRIDKLGL